MKKYIYLGFILLLSIVIQISYKSYAYQTDCSNYIDRPDNLNSIDVIEYIKKRYFEATVNYFCSNDTCYYLKDEKISSALNNYLIIQERKGKDEYVIEATIKGYPITEISFNLCE